MQRLVRRWIRWFGLGLLACGVLAAQSTVTGRLLLEHDGERLPLTDCTVFAPSTESGPLVGEYPDHLGRFELDFPPDPQVTVGTICPGYRVVEINGRKTLAPILDCSEPGRCAELELVLEPQGAIEGYVVDPHGMPVEDLSLELRLDAAGQRLRTHRVSSDDRGYFRFFHLPAGEYELEPIVGGRAQGEPIWRGDPRQISLASGDVVSSGQIRLREVEPVDLTGRIAGLPPGTTAVNLTLARTDGASIFSLNEIVKVDADGHFRFRGVAPGQYQVSMHLPDDPPAGAQDHNYIGAVDLTSAPGEVAFQRLEPGRLEGKIEFEPLRREDLTWVPDPSSFTFWLESEEGVRQFVWLRPPDHTFQVGRLRPGAYKFEFPGPSRVESRAGPDGEWEPLDEVLIQGGETTALELRVRFEPGRLTVVVKPPAGSDEAKKNLPAEHFVVGFRRDERVMLLPTDQNGRLELPYFSGGEYEICAWAAMTREQALDPETWRAAGDAVRTFRHEEGVDMEITLTAAP